MATCISPHADQAFYNRVFSWALAGVADTALPSASQLKQNQREKSMHTVKKQPGGAAQPEIADPAEPHDSSLWEFVPLADYKVPGLPARSAATKAWTSTKQFFRREKKEPPPTGRAQSSLCALSQTRLESLFTPIDWNGAATALDIFFDGWHTGCKPDPPVKFVIGQPYSGHAEIVSRWGEQHNAVLITPPSSEQILTIGERWLDDLVASEQLWVLPNLEHCFLRHAHGLHIVRRLLADAESGVLGQGLIGCDSWTWSYLQHIWPVPRHDALTLQAFDGQRLKNLLVSMIRTRRSRNIRFRNAESGNDILTVPTEDDQVHSEIIQLAAHCRGNAGTALHCWRNRLRSEPEDNDDTRTTKEPGDINVWVTTSQPEPASPSGTEEDSILVLHALLLHGGLPESLLTKLLPLSHNRSMAHLLQLQQGGLVHNRQDRWQVSEPAYPTVQAFLRGRAYLTDNF